MSTASELAGASSADIVSARNALVEYLQERWRDLTIRGGPLSDLVLGAAADALAAIDVRAAAAEVSYNPETALANGGYDSDILDSVLAGRGVSRIAAVAAAGTLAVRLTSDTTRTFQSGFRFETADGVVFSTSRATRLLKSDSTAVLAGDVVLVADPDGETYLGTVPIQCNVAGLAGNRPASTAFEAIDSFDSLDSAWAATDISGGLDAETDAKLLARLPAATAPRTAASLTGAEGLVRDAIPAISEVSTIKFGDTAMVRGRSALSTQTPGRFDVRYRTASSPARERTTVTATFIGLDGSFGSWRFSVPRNVSPGRFRVEKVLQEDQAITSSGYSPTNLVIGFDLSDIADPPDIRTAADASLSRYATAVVTFTDPDTPTDDLVVNVSERDYDVVCRLIAGVETGQAAVDAPDARAAGGDCLVRTAVPGLVSVTAAATAASGVTITAAQVASAVAQAVNEAAGIDNRLLSAQVAAAAATLLPQGTALLLSGWSATIYPNDGGDPVTATVESTGLIVADNFPRNISSATVAYCCDPESVTASVS